MDGQKICGKVMIKYLFDRYNRATHTDMLARVHDTLFCYFEEDEQFHFLCSWFCNTDEYLLKEWGVKENNCHFYDFDETVYEHNIKFHKNIHLKDVIFDNLDIRGNFIQKYCEYTYPVGKIYRGNFLLVGCDDEQLFIPNPVTSIKQLIEQNNINDVWYSETWSVTREYDQKEINYYLVAGCNI